MYLEHITPHEISHPEKLKNHMISLLCGIQNKKNSQTNKNFLHIHNSMAVTRGKGGGEYSKG